MNGRQFFDLVVTARKASKEYMANRSPEALKAFREATAKIDAEIQRVNDILATKK